MLVPSFTVSNNDVTTSSFSVVDTSTGADAAIANRLIYISLSDGSLFTGAPIQFPLSAGNSISPNILTSDFSFSMQIQWVDANGVVVEQISQIGVFTGFLEWFFYGLTQQIAAQSNIQNDSVFYDNWSKLRVLIDSASQAISIGGSIFNAQNMILMAQQLSTNPNLYF